MNAEQELRQRAEMAAQQAAAAAGIAPQPVPTQFQIFQRPDGRGGMIVEMSVQTVVGRCRSGSGWWSAGRLAGRT